MSFPESVPFKCTGCGQMHEAHLVPVYWTGQKPSEELSKRLIIEVAQQGSYTLLLTCDSETYPGEQDMDQFMGVIGQLIKKLVINVGLGRGEIVKADIIRVPHNVKRN